MSLYLQTPEQREHSSYHNLDWTKQTIIFISSLPVSKSIHCRPAIQKQACCYGQPHPSYHPSRTVLWCKVWLPAKNVLGSFPNAQCEYICRPCEMFTPASSCIKYMWPSNWSEKCNLLTKILQRDRSVCQAKGKVLICCWSLDKSIVGIIIILHSSFGRWWH